MEGWDGKYLSLTSYKRDGRPVATTVWFVAEAGRLLVITDAESYKVKRIRRNGRVSIARSTASGRLRGPQVEAQAELLPESEVERVELLLRRKYRVDRWIVLPVWRLVRRLKGKPESGRAVVVALTPAAGGG